MLTLPMCLSHFPGVAMPRKFLICGATICCTIFFASICSSHGEDPPSVTSAELVAHFVAKEADLTLAPGTSHVTEWRAHNDAAIALTAQGTDDPANIVYDPSGLGGLGSLVIRDYTGDNRYLRGSLNQDQTLSDVTIFWLGKYEPGADGSLQDGAGQYAYCLGPAGNQGSQMDHQIDDGHFELYGGSGTQSGGTINYLNGYHSVWQTDYFSSGPGHEAHVNGYNLNIPADDGYSVSTSSELQLFGWQNSSSVAGGYNFVGEFAEMLIYRGRLSENDAARIQSWLRDKLDQNPPHPPEPQTFNFAISGKNTRHDGIPAELFPHGNEGLRGNASVTFNPATGTMNWSIDLENNDANRYIVTQAHFYNLDDKPNGDSIFCWGGRWSDDDFLQGEGYSTPHIPSVLDNPEKWILMIHTEGGHFAVDEAGQLVEYSADLHETSETGQTESGTRFNNRVPRLLTNLLLREKNPVSGDFGDSDFDEVYPDPNHFLRENDTPYPDANGNHWIEWDAELERYVPTAYGAMKGLTLEDIDTKEYLFYRYDDQGPSWDYGGPEGAAAGVLEMTPIIYGDINLSGAVTNEDIVPFVELLLNGGYQVEADINQDDALTNRDVGLFVDLLLGSGGG